jgi:hypothetical protein
VKPGDLPKINAVPEIGAHRVEKNFNFVCERLSCGGLHCALRLLCKVPNFIKFDTEQCSVCCVLHFRTAGTNSILCCDSHCAAAGRNNSQTVSAAVWKTRFSVLVKFASAVL